MNRATRRRLESGKGRHDGRKVRHYLIRPTGEREVEIYLPPPVFDHAQRIMEAVRSQARSEREAGDELERILKPYFPLRYNPQRDYISLVREKAAQILTPAGAA
jgi:hypothetical protein